MNLDEMLAASGITGGAKAENTRTKTGFVTFIGRPNVGKSTLMNQIIGQKIAITSNKPQTTRNRIQTVYTDERGQIVFVDTPGIHKAKNKLGEYMVGAAEKTISEVDLICWLVEPTTHLGAAEEHIVEKLKECKTPIVLVINKTDTIKKEEILPVIDCYRKELDFVDIVPVCARNGNNVDDLLDVIFSHLDYGPMYYDEDTVTDQPMKQIVAELIREKALHALMMRFHMELRLLLTALRKEEMQEVLLQISTLLSYVKEIPTKELLLARAAKCLRKSELMQDTRLRSSLT